MKEKTVFYKSSGAITALFLLGNAIIIMPYKGADEYTFLGFLASAICGIFAIIFLNPLADFLDKEQTNKAINIIKIILLLSLAVASAFLVAEAFRDFTNFISEIILPDIRKTVIVITFAFTILFFVLKRQEHILKFSLLCCGFTIISIIFFFFATFKNFDMRNVFIFRLPSPQEFWNAISPYLKRVVLPILLIPFYRIFVFGNKHATACTHGTILGFILLGLCILSSILLFSPQLAGRLDYPYAAAISTITVGKLFTRMDGFSYLLYFAATIIKINICAFVSFQALKRINRLLV